MGPDATNLSLGHYPRRGDREGQLRHEEERCAGVRHLPTATELGTPINPQSSCLPVGTVGPKQILGCGLPTDPPVHAEQPSGHSFPGSPEHNYRNTLPRPALLRPPQPIAQVPAGTAHSNVSFCPDLNSPPLSQTRRGKDLHGRAQ